MTKLRHRASLDGNKDRARCAEVGDPEFGELIDRIFDKGMVFDAADRIKLTDNEQVILGAREEPA